MSIPVLDRFPAARTTPMTAAGAALLLATAACSGVDQDAAEGNGSADGEMPTDVVLAVPFSEGGGTDTWARFIAPYLEEAVDGDVTFHVENWPGGEGITGTNRFTREADASGETLLVGSGTVYNNALVGRPEVEYDMQEMRLLMVNGTSGVVYVDSDSGISVDNLDDPPTDLVYGGISATGADLSLLQAFDLLDVEVDATFGFEGRGAARLALERDEINVDYQTTSAYNTHVQPLVDDGEAEPLMTYGYIDDDGEVVRDPNFPDLPTVEEVYEELHGEAPSGPAYDAYRAALLSGFIYQKGVWANGDLPDDIAEAYGEAAAELNEDEEFQEAAQDVLGGYPLLPGSEGEDILMDAFQLEDGAQQHITDMLAEEYDVTF